MMNILGQLQNAVSEAIFQYRQKENPIIMNKNNTNGKTKKNANRTQK